MACFLLPLGSLKESLLNEALPGHFIYNRIVPSPPPYSLPCFSTMLCSTLTFRDFSYFCSHKIRECNYSVSLLYAHRMWQQAPSQAEMGMPGEPGHLVPQPWHTWRGREGKDRLRFYPPQQEIIADLIRFRGRVPNIAGTQSLNPCSSK